MIDLEFCQFYDTQGKDSYRFYDHFDKARLMDAIKGYHAAESIVYGKEARDMIDKVFLLVVLGGGDIDDKEYNEAHEVLTGIVNDLKVDGRYGIDSCVGYVPKYPRVLEVLANEYIGYSGDIKTYRRGYLHTFHEILDDFYVDIITEKYKD